MKQPPRFAPLLFILLAPFTVQAQQPGADSTVVNTPLVDSLQAALDRFETARPPTAADSAALHRWADSVQIRSNAIIRSEPARARGILEEALDAYRTLHDSSKSAEATRDLGKAFSFQSQYEKALTRYREALKIQRQIGDRHGIGNTLNSIGLIHGKTGRYKEAIAHFHDALGVRQEIEDQRGIGNTLHNLGVIHWSRGRYDRALARFNESLEIMREIGDREDIAKTLQNLGLIHRGQGRYDEALASYREALPIFRETGDPKTIASTLNNIGIVHKSQGRYDQALARYRESLKIKREIGDRQGIASTLNNIGTVHKRQGRYDQALARYRESLKIMRQIGDREGIATTLNNIGNVYKKQGRSEEALAPYREALRKNREIGQSPGIARNLQNLGELHLAQDRLPAATDTLARAVRLADDLRLNATSPEARRSLLSTQIGAYQALTTAYVRSGEPDSALRSVERARARLLADRLAGTATGDTTFSIPSVTDLRRVLGPNEAALLYANAGTQWPLTTLVVTRNRVLARELPDSTIRAAIEEAYPTQLNRLRREEGPLTAALGANRSQKQGTTPSLAEIIRLYRYYLTREQSDASIQKRLSRHLHGLLVEPIAGAIANKNELVTVPTGALGYLPFETLRDSTGTSLIEDKHVRYAQSLTVLRQLQHRDYGPRKRPLLALGGAAYASDPFPESGTLVADARGGSPRVATRGHATTLLQSAEQRMKQGKSPRPTYKQLGYRTWSDLPGTKTEVTRLGRSAGSKATVITGRSVSEDTVRALSERGQLRQYRRIHFATHGIAVPETPALSALVLSQIGTSDSLAARDGYLTMEEIAGLDLNADVSVLSACQTGLGRIIAGEGVVSLSHAFLRAGANATLVSQWKVLDKSTRTFMTAVYQRAEAEDTSFAKAVSKTKRDFLAGEHGEKNTDPLRWAPFVYYGRE